MFKEEDDPSFRQKVGAGLGADDDDDRLPHELIKARLQNMYIPKPQPMEMRRSPRLAKQDMRLCHRITKTCDFST